MAAAGIRVQMCVTSPPYWGLRDYGIEPSVWGGLPDCAHVWGDEVSIHKGGPTGRSTGVPKREANAARDNTADRQAGQFCQCGAWLGTLGLEPDYRMYVDHMVEVMDLVRDVLADDGTLWLNMGDSYATGAGTDPRGNRGQHLPRQAGKAKYRVDAVGPMTQPNRTPQPGLKPKDLCLMPARVAIALQEAGWWVRQDIIWSKPSPMPESVTDRCTKSHEYLFLLSKQSRYYYDADAIREKSTSGRDDMREKGIRTGLGYLQQDAVPSNAVKRQKEVAGWDTGPGSHSTIEHNREPRGRKSGNKSHKGKTAYDAGDEMRRTTAGLLDIAETVYEYRNKRSVWTVPAEPYPEAHFATFPRKLIEPCVLAGSRQFDIVLDPFMGSGTTAQVAEHLGRQWIGCELNPEYLALQRDRLRQQSLEL